MDNIKWYALYGLKTAKAAIDVIKICLKDNGSHRNPTTFTPQAKMTKGNKLKIQIDVIKRIRSFFLFVESDNPLYPHGKA